MKLLRFLSLAALTQLTLAINQLAILPAQLRGWGTELTASWYSAIAIAMLASVADFGLRVAGHPDLLRWTAEPSDGVARANFLRVWSWVRLLVVASTLGLIAGEFALQRPSASGDYAPWHALLIGASGIEALLVVRAMYMDTLGLYDKAELGYFLFSLLRSLLALGGLVLLGWRETALAIVYAITALLGMAVQGWLSRQFPQIALAAPLRLDGARQTFALMARTMSDPISNWTRLSLPVVVLSAVAPPAAVTTYVALRALFGLVRATIQQLARVASVEFLRLAQSAQPTQARAVLLGFLLLGALFGTVVSLGVAADNKRLIELWLGEVEGASFYAIAVPFCLGAPFYVYQMLLSLRVRMGDLQAIALRQYGFVACAAVASAFALVSATWSAYLWLMLASELLVGLLLMLRLDGSFGAMARDASGHGLRAAALWAAALSLFFLLVQLDPSEIFSKRTFSSIVLSCVATLTCLGLSTLAIAHVSRDALGELRTLGVERVRSSLARRARPI
jgi:hypothetical protein